MSLEVRLDIFLRRHCVLGRLHDSQSQEDSLQSEESAAHETASIARLLIDKSDISEFCKAFSHARRLHVGSLLRQGVALNGVECNATGQYPAVALLDLLYAMGAAVPSSLSEERWINLLHAVIRSKCQAVPPTVPHQTALQPLQPAEQMPAPQPLPLTDADTAQPAQNVASDVLVAATQPANNRAKYEAMTKEVLVNTVIARDESLNRLRTGKRSLQQHFRRNTRRAATKSVALVEAKARSDMCSFEIVRKRPGGTQVSVQGAMSIALRRNLSNIASSDFGYVALDDLGRHVVTRSEVSCAAALLASSANFYATMKQHWASQVAAGDNDTYQLALHVVRGDATNGNIWQNRKLHTLQVLSEYLCEGEVLVNKSVADLQPVSDASGRGTFTMMVKELSSLGCPTWMDMLNLIEPRA